MQFFCYLSVTGFSNSYLIGPDKGGDGILIDPGIFDVPLLHLIEENNLNIKYILLTHSHESHIYGIKTLLKVYNAEIYCYNHSIYNMKTNQIRNDDELKLGEFMIKVMESPGHTGDSLIFQMDKLLFTGDTLFSGTIGSTPDNITKELLISIVKEKILTLDDEHFIFPGHGPPSKVGIEKILNPYL